MIDWCSDVQLDMDQIGPQCLEHVSRQRRKKLILDLVRSHGGRAKSCKRTVGHGVSNIRRIVPSVAGLSAAAIYQESTLHARSTGGPASYGGLVRLVHLEPALP